MPASAAPGSYDMPLQWGVALAGSNVTVTISHADALSQELPATSAPEESAGRGLPPLPVAAVVVVTAGAAAAGAARLLKSTRFQATYTSTPWML